jgi:hypothetical protein
MIRREAVPDACQALSLPAALCLVAVPSIDLPPGGNDPRCRGRAHGVPQPPNREPNPPEDAERSTSPGNSDGVGATATSAVRFCATASTLTASTTSPSARGEGIPSTVQVDAIVLSVGAGHAPLGVRGADRLVLGVESGERLRVSTRPLNRAQPISDPIGSDCTRRTEAADFDAPAGVHEPHWFRTDRERRPVERGIEQRGDVGILGAVVDQAQLPV